MSVKWWATTVVEMQFGTGATPGPYYSHWQQDNRVPTNQTTSGTVSTGSQLASPLTAGCVCYRVAFNTTPLNNNARLGGMGLFGTTRALIAPICGRATSVVLRFRTLRWPRRRIQQIRSHG